MNGQRLIESIAFGSSKRIQEFVDQLSISLSPELMAIDSLKQSLIDDPFIELTALSSGSFNAHVNNGDIFKESILRDFYCGYSRVVAQYNALASLRSHKAAPPWDLTTAYYCAFFSAIELLRLHGIFQISFDSVEHEALLSKMHGNSAFLQKSQHFTGKISSCGEEIFFTSNAQKPHQSVWRNIHDTLTSPLAQRYPDWKEVHTLNLILCGRGNWYKPSDVRNAWNYKRVEFYSDVGRPLISEFYSLIENSASVSSWLERSFSISPSEKAIASSVAAVCEVFTLAVMSAYSNFSVLSPAKSNGRRKDLKKRERRRLRNRNKK